MKLNIRQRLPIGRVSNIQKKKLKEHNEIKDGTPVSPSKYMRFKDFIKQMPRKFAYPL
jgi:hypothetical protein